MATHRRVAIVGAALSDCGRVDDLTEYELHYQGTSRAVRDAGLAKDDIDCFMSTGTGTLPPIDVAEYLGLRPKWVDSTMVGGSSWEFLVDHAMAAISLGLIDVAVLSYASTTRADLKKHMRSANLGFSTRGPAQFDSPWGFSLISKYAMAARRHMIEFGTTIEQLAEIAVSARYNAALNPDAFYREPITIDDVQSGPVLADPFTKLHCCIRSDGGGAQPTLRDGIPEGPCARVYRRDVESDLTHDARSSSGCQDAGAVDRRTLPVNPGQTLVSHPCILLKLYSITISRRSGVTASGVRPNVTDEQLARIPLIVDLDAHLVEPADLWTSRLPARYRDIGPHVELLPMGRRS
jgi:acetyl-CoA acetyltransferase